MAEKIISPGVFTKEIDASFLPAAIGDIGAVIVGPTVKGPALTPTVVNSYGEFQSKFGDVFREGNGYYQYLTSHTAKNYLEHSGKLTVVRIMGANYSQASASINNEDSTTGALYASASIKFSSSFFAKDPDATGVGSGEGDEVQITVGGTEYRFVSSDPNNIPADSSNVFFVASGSSTATAIGLITASINDADIGVKAGTNNSPDGSGANAINLTHLVISASDAGTGGNSITVETGSGGTISTDVATLSGGVDSTTDGSVVFKLHTLSHGSGLNNASSAVTTNNLLSDGSENNVRWEISNKNNNKGTFQLIIRRGDDTIKRKQILETWNDLSIDPNANNYINKVIGDQYTSINGTATAPFLSWTGDYPVKSKYVRVETIKQTADYLDENGNVNNTHVNGANVSASLPAVGSGSLHGGFQGGLNGTESTPISASLNENIGQITQGFDLNVTAQQNQYIKALSLLSNADEYDFNLLLIPGIIRNQTGHTAVVTKAIDICEDRGDAFVVIDTVPQSNDSLSTVTGQAKAMDTNYGATYWPWVQVPDPQLGGNVWVPPTVVIAGVYAFNDKVGAPWFAPAGLNRGTMPTVVQAKRKLTHANRDELYSKHVNPLATFPGQGVVVWGQKTLQKKASALDRVNVRRLLIKVKKFISASSRFLVFEQNNAATRERFLNIANPYLEQVQAQSGLNAFRVVMDDTNNTPDVIDRNQLYGQLFLQPTKTAEFIILDFTIQRSGATFPE